MLSISIYNTAKKSKKKKEDKESTDKKADDAQSEKKKKKKKKSKDKKGDPGHDFSKDELWSRLPVSVQIAVHFTRTPSLSHFQTELWIMLVDYG